MVPWASSEHHSASLAPPPPTPPPLPAPHPFAAVIAGYCKCSRGHTMKLDGMLLRFLQSLNARCCSAFLIFDSSGRTIPVSPSSSFQSPSRRDLFVPVAVVQLVLSAVECC